MAMAELKAFLQERDREREEAMTESFRSLLR